MREGRWYGDYGNLVNNKVRKIKNGEFLENITNLLKESQKQKLDLYRINNHLKSELLNCTKLNEIFNINIEVFNIFKTS